MRYFFAYDVIFSNSQPSLGTRSSNGGRKFSEIKVKKRITSNVRNGLNFGKICKKVSYYTRKCKKNEYQKFDRSSTLKKSYLGFLPLQL